ncbi:MAG: hypothetical protein DWQ37_21735 [Planctomycetota bacterium]|nr:MAG: hypothetical protein DWQ37_21735 [Planctomycetota bacterium]
MNVTLAGALFAVGLGQLSVLIASALVPVRLNWRREFQALSPLHRQMYWVYGGYVVLSIVALGTITLTQSGELAAGGSLARAFCVYAAVFWGIRLALQAVLDVREHLTTWWLRAGYYALTVLFATFTVVFAWAAVA